LSVPNRRDDSPSFRASQVFTSTPLDAQRPPSSPSESHVSYHLEEDQLVGGTYGPNPDSAAESDDDDGKSDFSHGVRDQSLEPEGDDVPLGYASDAEEPQGADESDAEHESQLPDTHVQKPLDADDAVSERILTVPTAVRRFSI
jgi:hypothetical protein